MPLQSPCCDSARAGAAARIRTVRTNKRAGWIMEAVAVPVVILGRAATGERSALGCHPGRNMERPFPDSAALHPGCDLLRQMPIENFCPVPRCDAGPAQDLLEGALHVADAMWHAREIGMHGDRHEFRPRRRLGIEPFELVHDGAAEPSVGRDVSPHHGPVRSYRARRPPAYARS